MGGSYFVEGGVIHAKTMLAYHRDGLATARGLIIMFTGVICISAWLWVDSLHPAFLFSGGIAVVLVGIGIGLVAHHGKKIAHWERKLERWENLRRDRLIHARHLKGFEL